MARQAKKENTENMDVTDQPDVETTVAENNAENIVPDAGNSANRPISMCRQRFPKARLMK